MQNPLNDDERHVLEVMLERVERSFALARTERKRLHEEEWSANAEGGSVLGEAEMLSDMVVGIGTTWLQRGWGAESRSALLGASVHRSRKLHAWLQAHADGYPHFAAYIQAAEYLRAFYLEIMSA